MANEKRLIDAYKLEDLLRSNAARYHHKDDVIAAIAGQPTVDAVEVVRCKDCKNRQDEGKCPMYHVDEIEWDDDGYMEVDYVPHDYTADDGFCDRGERKDNERKAD